MQAYVANLKTLQWIYVDQYVTFQVPGKQGVILRYVVMADVFVILRLHNPFGTKP